MKSRNNIFLLLFILVIATFLRFYRMEDLAVFLSDQASDSTKVLEMTRGKLTLLGPITSVGGFFNGPIVYYLMFPFYFFLKSDPVAGTLFQAVFSIATIPLLYLIGKRLKHETVGLLSSFLFAISPLMIDYSRAAFNSYPAIFFSTLIIYLFLKIIDQISILYVFLMGIAIGFIVQMHYFAIAFVFTASIYPLLFKKKLVSLRYYFVLFCGIVMGLLPFIVFELRHSFLNVHLFLKYITSQTKSTNKSGIFNLSIWPTTTGLLFFGENITFGFFGLLTTLVTTIIFYLKKYVKREYLALFILLFIVVFSIGQLYGRQMQHHYIISFHTSFIILFALSVYYLLRKNVFLIIIFSFLLFFINMPHWNLEKDRHPLQQGMTIADFKKAGSIIHEDKKGIYNVGMHTQGDNRAMPLRYILNLLKDMPLDYTDYQGAETLYFIVLKNEPITNLKMWEYTSFGPSKVISLWEINTDYFLYKLVKK